MKIRKLLALVLAVTSLAGCAVVGDGDETTGTMAGDELIAGSDGEDANGDDVADGVPGAERGERSHVTSALRAYDGDDRNGPQPIPWQPAPASGSGGSGKD